MSFYLSVFGAVTPKMEPLERLQADGALALEIPLLLGQLPSGRELRVFLEHHLVRDWRGREKSEWLFWGASGYIKIDDIGSWIADLPGFRARRITRLYSHDADGIVGVRGRTILKALDTNRMVLAIGASATFSFSAGILTRWREGNTTFETTMQGGRVVSIKKVTGNNSLLFEASYSPSGQPRTIKSGEREIIFTYTNDDKMTLLCITVSTKGEIVDHYHFTYEDGLLSSIVHNLDRLGPIVWRFPAFYCPEQMRRTTLASDGEYDYLYKAKYGIVTMTAVNRRTGEKELSVYNMFKPARQAPRPAMDNAAEENSR